MSTTWGQQTELPVEEKEEGSLLLFLIQGWLTIVIVDFTVETRDGDWRMQRVEEKVFLRTCNTWDGHYARVMLLLLPINKTFPWILNRAKRKCADILVQTSCRAKCADIFGTCTLQTSCLLPSKRKPEDRDLLFLRRVEMIVFLSSNHMDLRCR